MLYSRCPIYRSLFSAVKTMEAKRPSSKMSDFREIFKKAKDVVILTGAGVSAESGIPTFRGPGGFWRKYQAQDLATPQAFKANPSLVWEFYHHRREVALTKEPNSAHKAIAECQSRLSNENKKVWVVTQNIDGLHQRAGAKDVIELHGSLFKTRCLKCGKVEENRDSPICPALGGKGAPDPKTMSADIPEKDLPRCKTESCNGLLRPHIVWFGEMLDVEVLALTEKVVEECDLCLVVGTSSVVYPAAMFAPLAARRGVPVAEFNVETTPATEDFMWGKPASPSRKGSTALPAYPVKDVLGSLVGREILFSSPTYPSVLSPRAEGMRNVMHSSQLTTKLSEIERGTDVVEKLLRREEEIHLQCRRERIYQSKYNPSYKDILTMSLPEYLRNPGKNIKEYARRRCEGEIYWI